MWLAFIGGFDARPARSFQWKNFYITPARIYKIISFFFSMENHFDRAYETRYRMSLSQSNAKRSEVRRRAMGYHHNENVDRIPKVLSSLSVHRTDSLSRSMSRY